MTAPASETQVQHNLFQLPLLIARAGQNDSLRWWEDDSLTDAGAYLLERLFPFAPHIQGRKLALLAARARHDAALKNETASFHLFQSIEVSDRDLTNAPLPSDPVKSVDDLCYQLSVIIPQEPANLKIHPVASNGTVQVELPEGSSQQDASYALAWAYLKGKPGQPVFPYIKQT